MQPCTLMFSFFRWQQWKLGFYKFIYIKMPRATSGLDGNNQLTSTQAGVLETELLISVRWGRAAPITAQGLMWLLSNSCTLVLRSSKSCRKEIKIHLYFITVQIFDTLGKVETENPPISELSHTHCCHSLVRAGTFLCSPQTAAISINSQSDSGACTEVDYTDPCGKLGGHCAMYASPRPALHCCWHAALNPLSGARTGWKHDAHPLQLPLSPLSLESIFQWVSVQIWFHALHHQH